MPYAKKLSRAEVSALRTIRSKPRGRWAGTDERAQLEAFKKTMRDVMCGKFCSARLKVILESPATESLVFVRALEFVASRVGLPPQAQVQVGVNMGMALLKAPEWLGWPQLGEGEGGEVGHTEVVGGRDDAGNGPAGNGPASS
jgi:hypothetical protein